MADTDIPTMTIRPASRQAGQGGTDPGATKPWTGGKLSYGDMVQKWKDRGYSDAGARGMADNMTRESSGDPTAIGPGGAAIGLFQHEGPRREALEKFAKERGTKPTDPDTQFEFADNELKRDYPTLRAKLRNTNDRADAEDSFKRVFERPKSVLWGERPKIATDQFRFSPYAIREHASRPNTDVVLMSPDDYLDLSPVLGGKPFDSPAGRSLLASADRGEAMEAIPTLDVDVKGKTGTVTDQAGRHRAMLAKHAGVDAIPVAIQKNGEGDPTELTGAQGKVVPNTFPKVAPLRSEATGEKPKERSLLQKMGDAIIPRAEAGEPKPAGNDDGWVDANPPGEAKADAAAPSGGDDGWVDAKPPEEPGEAGYGLGAIGSAIKGAGAGVGRTMLGAQQLLGKGLQALPSSLGATGAGDWLVKDARRGLDTIDREIAPDEAEHPWATTAGDIAGGMAGPGGAAKLIGTAGRGLARNALKGAALGAGNAAFQPASDENYWRDKALQTGVGAVIGGGLGAVGEVIGSGLTPKPKPEAVKLMREGVRLTPGQMFGGARQRYEDKATSLPLTGDAIDAARRRSYDDFNRVAWNRVLEPLGEKMPDHVPMGRQAMNYVNDKVDDAYAKILPNLSLNAVQNDTTFVNDMMTATANARANLPDAQFAQFERIVRAQIEQKLGPSGTSFDGRIINGIDSMLGKKVRGYKSDPTHDNRELGEALEEVQAGFRNLLERHNPAHANDLKQARAAYARWVRVSKAASMQGTAKTEGIFSPAQLNQAVRSESNTVRKMGYGRGDELLQDLSDAAMAVLPSTYPDSGTAGRLMMGAMLGSPLATASAFLHNPIPAILGVGGLSLGASPYTKRANNLTNSIMNTLAQQPGPTRAAASNALRLAGQGGGAGLGAAAAGSIPTMTIRPGDNQGAPQ